MAKVNHMLKQQLKMNNHGSRHIQQTLQGRLKLNPIFVLKETLNLKLKKQLK